MKTSEPQAWNTTAQGKKGARSYLSVNPPWGSVAGPHSVGNYVDLHGDNRLGQHEGVSRLSCVPAAQRSLYQLDEAGETPIGRSRLVQTQSVARQEIARAVAGGVKR